MRNTILGNVKKKNFLPPLIFLIITGLTLYFRFFNLNWDLSHSFHPDERNIICSSVNASWFYDPGFYSYGSLPSYVYRIIADFLTQITGVNYVSYSNLLIIGRSTSAFVGTISVVLFYFLLKKFFSNYFSLLGMLFMSTSMYLIQTSHYATTESLMLMYTILILLSTINLVNKKNILWAIILGTFFGVSLGTKITSVSYLLIILSGYLWIFINNYKTKLVQTFGLLSLTLFTALCFLIITWPWLFLNFDKFLEASKYEIGVINGSLNVPYTKQYISSLNYFYELKNLSFWSLNFPILFLSAFGLIVMLKNFTKKSYAVVIILPYFILYFLIIGQNFAKFNRYMIPIVPIFIILSVFALKFLYSYFKTKSVKKYYFHVLILILVITQIFFAFSYMAIYFSEQTRITTSKWIYENVPIGSKLLTEHWDDGLPIQIDGYSASFQSEELKMYDQDNEAKIFELAEKLSSSDYVILSSRKLWSTIIKLENEYPISSVYYKKLFSGELGYDIEYQGRSFPRLGKMVLNDNWADESFQDYDHPETYVFKNQIKLSENELIKLLK